MPNQLGKDQDDTASIRSSVSSIFPSSSSKPQTKRRPLTNLWVFTNSSRDASRTNDTKPDTRPESSASVYDDTPSIKGERTFVRSRRFNGLWHSTNNTPLISPVPTVKEDETTPTSSQFPTLQSPVEEQGLSSLRRNGKLLRSKTVDSVLPMTTTPVTATWSSAASTQDRLPLRSPRVNDPGLVTNLISTSNNMARDDSASPSHPPVTYNSEQPRSPRSPRRNPDIDVPHATTSRSSSIQRKGATGSGSRSPGRANSSKGLKFGSAASVAREIGEMQDVPSDEEGSMAGGSTDLMDSLIMQVNPKKKGQATESGVENRKKPVIPTGRPKDASTRSKKIHTHTGSRDLHSIAAELSGGKVVPTRTASIPATRTLSIDDIVRKHASETPEVFGLSRESLKAMPAAKDEEEGGSLEAAMKGSVLLLEKLDSLRSTSGRSSSSMGHPVPPKPSSSGIAHSSDSNTIVSLTSSESWESLKRKIEREDDPQTSVAKYLRSRRLNRYITLERPGQAGQVLSYAEVGDPQGYPVLVFLGLGCVRYLIALYDELALAEGIRLICIDRWGLGKSQDVAPESRGLLEWANAVKEVMDRLNIDKFGMLAHSAGVPYALTTALRLKERVVGTIHLLAPWVNMEVDGTYKWLKYVPSSVIKTAQATEWKLHGWKLGSLPGHRPEGIGYTPPQSERTVMGTASGYFVGRSGRGSLANIKSGIGKSEAGRSAWHLNEGTKLGYALRLASPMEPSRPPVSPLTRPKSMAGKLVRRLSNTRLNPSTSLDHLPYGTRVYSPSVASSRSGLESPGAFPLRSSDDVTPESAPLHLAGKGRPIPDRTTSLPLLALDRQSSRAGSVASSASSSGPLAGESSLATAILRASHAEALQGGTSDLLAILGKDTQGWGFSYTHISHPCQVWLGEKDDKIGQRGARWMEREMKACRVKVLSGEGHMLMTSTKAIVAVFSALQTDVRDWKSSRT